MPNLVERKDWHVWACVEKRANDVMSSIGRWTSWTDISILAYFPAIWLVFSTFGITLEFKSGNPGRRVTVRSS